MENTIDAMMRKSGGPNVSIEACRVPPLVYRQDLPNCVEVTVEGSPNLRAVGRDRGDALNALIASHPEILKTVRTR
jgi:hypothetical protein